MGIIDYVRQYTWDKMVESVSKMIIVKSGTTPTIIIPRDYSDRFEKAMNKYFV
jgi:1-phosphatidylinositol-3-phosphate 5-kinase